LSGVPFNPLVSSDIANVGNTTQRPNRLASGKLSSPSPTDWYNVAAFADAAPGTFGNSGRNILIGPGISNADLSLFKEFKFHKRHTVPFRSEFFNALNTPHLGQPNATVDAQNLAGRISVTSQANRQIQFALKYLF
jgi:hypothetical protein